MEEITLDDLQGTWLGDEYNLIIGHRQNSGFARLVNKADNTIVETKSLELSEVTEENTRILIFSKEYSIEVWGWYTKEMTLTIDNNRYNVAFLK
ncbi:conserved hypothetical protein [Tenacibaculum litopenaei]|uniref:hypothetical protein n=1 Tax=Tenacibaculum litopenaei TaxID=396016 RepID=UPI00389463F8